MAKTVQEWFDESEDWQKPLLRDLREIIFSAVPDAKEDLKWGQPCYKRNSNFCYLQRAKSHVTLGFQKGAKFSDPHGLLTGEGKQMRHVAFPAGSSIDRALCLALINEANRLD